MSVHVEQHGAGPDLVLLHGWALHSGVFAQLWPVLAQRHRVHLIDLPGHGRSAPHDAMADLQQLAQCVRAHVPDNAVLIGWSLGGLLTLKLAQQMPLRAMVLVNTTPRFVATEAWPHGMAQPVFAQFFAKLQSNLEVTVQDFLALQVRGDAEAAATLQQLKAALLAHPGDPQALQQGLNILRNADERGALPGIAVPALVMSGEYDRITHPKASAALAAQLPSAQTHLIKRAGHAPFLSHREEFLDVVTRFIDELPAAGAST